MGETLVLNVSNDRIELERISTAAEEMGQRENWPAAMLFKINLALEEFVLNVMTHGYHEALTEIRVTLTSDEEAVSIEILDDGLPFDPLNDAPAPDLTTGIEGRKIGGLGVFLVLDMMNQVHYAREGDNNCLTMKMLRHG